MTPGRDCQDGGRAGDTGLDIPCPTVSTSQRSPCQYRVPTVCHSRHVPRARDRQGAQGRNPQGERGSWDGGSALAADSAS